MPLTKEQAEQTVKKVALFPPHVAVMVRHPDGGWIVDLHLRPIRLVLDSPEWAGRALAALSRLCASTT